jgi:membrane-bound metal-dependent hydrolase YbcI (DUF457 family)
MPFTPFHLGPALFFGLLLFALVDFPTFLVANIIVDIEPFLVVFLGLDYPLHGFFHSFIGGSIVAVGLAFVMMQLRGITGKVMKFLRLEQKASWKSVLVASFLGVYFHILLDTPLYPDIRPFYPFDVNPFFFSDIFVSIYMYMFCIFCFLVGSIMYFVKLAVKLRRAKDSK